MIVLLLSPKIKSYECTGTPHPGICLLYKTNGHIAISSVSTFMIVIIVLTIVFSINY